jgi:DNA polymerase III sliding clamp (beta) subunit (PCNA family)
VSAYVIHAPSLRAALAAAPKGSPVCLDVSGAGARVLTYAARSEAEGPDGEGPLVRRPCLVTARRVVCDQGHPEPPEARFMLPAPALVKVLDLARRCGADWVSLSPDERPGWHPPLNYAHDAVTARLVQPAPGTPAASWTLTTDGDAGEFPALPGGQGGRVVPAAELLRGLERVLAFRARPGDSDRYALANVQTVLSSDAVRFVATDGHRLAVQAVGGDAAPGGGPDGAEVMLDPGAVKPLAALLKAARGDEVTVSVSPDGWLCVRRREDLAAFRPAPGRFPLWRDCFPSGGVAEIPLDARKVTAALESVCRTARGAESDTTVLAFSATAGQLRYECPDVGRAVERFDLPGDGWPFGCSVNPFYLLDVFRSAGGAGRVRLTFTDHKGVLVFSTEDGFTAAVMPKTDGSGKPPAFEPEAVAPAAAPAPETRAPEPAAVVATPAPTPRVVRPRPAARPAPIVSGAEPPEREPCLDCGTTRGGKTTTGKYERSKGRCQSCYNRWRNHGRASQPAPGAALAVA